ncbi:hypothetical protein GQ457_18G019280 [Hibiscus cannabinus]
MLVFEYGLDIDVKHGYLRTMKVYKMLTDECSTATKHMIPTKKLIRVARKWQKIVAIGRRIISSVRIDNKKLAAANCSNESSAVDRRLLCYLHIGRETFCDPLGVSRNCQVYDSID